MLNVTRA